MRIASRSGDHLAHVGVERVSQDHRQPVLGGGLGNRRGQTRRPAPGQHHHRARPGQLGHQIGKGRAGDCPALQLRVKTEQPHSGLQAPLDLHFPVQIPPRVQRRCWQQPGIALRRLECFAVPGLVVVADTTQRAGEGQRDPVAIQLLHQPRQRQIEVPASLHPESGCLRLSPARQRLLFVSCQPISRQPLACSGGSGPGHQWSSSLL